MKRRTLILAAVVVSVALLVTSGWSWVALAYYASSYPATGANVVIHGERAYVARGEDGVDIVELQSGKVLGRIETDIDDVAVADGFLFALDAQTPGHLSVFTLDGKLVSPPVEVPVGPFSGVSAGGGRVIVSGGTSQMTLRSYDANGKLSSLLATADFGRGQPDVLLAPDGQRAFVSTHYWGPYFGVTAIEIGEDLTEIGAIELDTYGFTAGGAKPASFPLECALEHDVLLVAELRGLNVISAKSLDVLAKIDVGVKAVNVDVRDNIAAVVGSSPKPLLALVDVSSPASPRVIRSIALPPNSKPTGVAIGATHVAVAAHGHELLLIAR